MTLYQVEARNAPGGLLSFELADISDGLLLAKVDGLDPVKATLVSTSFAALDGEQFHSARREPRNITMKVELRPDYVTSTPESLRSRIYDYFMPKTQVFLRLYSDSGLTVNITGIVETCESTIFAQKPVMDISVMCFNPDFIDVDTATLEGSTVSTTTETTVTYDGSVETGIVFTLNLNRTLTDFTIYHRAPDGTLRQLDFSESLASGDILTITTTPGSKSAILTHSGSDTSILNGVSPQSNWISLSKGDNTIRVFASGAAIPFTITYMNKYGGL